MSELRIRQGARAPLFDRLVDLEPWVPTEPEPLRTLDRAGLQESVRRYLTWLLNSRRAVDDPELAEQVPTVLSFGIPDLVSSSLLREADIERLRVAVERAVGAFEPRLRGTRVEVESVSPDARSVALLITAQLVVETITSPVSFALQLGAGGAAAEVTSRG